MLHRATQWLRRNAGLAVAATVVLAACGEKLVAPSATMTADSEDSGIPTVWIGFTSVPDTTQMGASATSQHLHVSADLIPGMPRLASGCGRTITGVAFDGSYYYVAEGGSGNMCVTRYSSVGVKLDSKRFSPDFRGLHYVPATEMLVGRNYSGKLYKIDYAHGTSVAITSYNPRPCHSQAQPAADPDGQTYWIWDTQCEGSTGNVERHRISDNALLTSFPATGSSSNSGGAVAVTESAVLVPNNSAINAYSKTGAFLGAQTLSGDTQGCGGYAFGASMDGTKVMFSPACGFVQVEQITPPGNTPPTVSLSATATGNEGTPIALSATAGDQDGDALTYSWDINGDGIIDSVKTTPDVSLTYTTPGTYAVTVRVDDGYGNSASAASTVTVANVAPTINTINPAASIPVGGTFNLNANFTDPGPNDGAWTASVDWGDNSTPASITLSSLGAIAASHAYSAFGSYVVKVTVTDKLGLASAVSTVAVSTTDVTPPEIKYVVGGTAGTNNWFTGDVMVKWTVTDPESGMSSSTGCDNTTLTTDTDANGITYTCTAKNGAGLTSTQSVTVKRDATVPRITPSANGATGNAGWYTSNVSIAWNVATGPSGTAAANGCSAATLANDTDASGASYTCAVTSGAGLRNSASTTVKRDATAPVVAYSGNAGAYTVDQTVNIACAASDPTPGSGLASSTCAPITGNAYAFALGANGFAAAGTDIAGNVGHGSTSFTVQVTYTSLSALVGQVTTNQGTVNSLGAKLAAAQASAAAGDTNAKAGQLRAFVNEVQAQTGKAIAADKAAVLIRLANAL